MELPTTPDYVDRVIKLQALVRGFVGRVKVNRKRVAVAAKTTGLLVALKEKEQGKSGWYQAPGGDVFYFVRDEKAEWLLAAGPISRTDYDTAVLNVNSITPGNNNNNSNSNNNILSPKTASGSGLSVALLRKNGIGSTSGIELASSSAIEPGDVLRKCAFELAVDHEDVKGDLYLANKTNKLYVAVSVDTLLLESLFAASASYSYISGNSGTNTTTGYHTNTNTNTNSNTLNGMSSSLLENSTSSMGSSSVR